MKKEDVLKALQLIAQNKECYVFTHISTSAVPIFQPQ